MSCRTKPSDGIEVESRTKTGGDAERAREELGGRPTENPCHDVRGSSPTLDEQNISYKQSELWQKVADVTEERFQAFIEEITAKRLVRKLNNLSLARPTPSLHKPLITTGVIAVLPNEPHVPSV